MISETKMKIVIDNYFKTECDVNTSIRNAFEKGFRIGVIKGQTLPSELSKTQLSDQAKRWIPCSEQLPNEIGYYLVTVCAEFRPVRIYGFFPWDLDEMKKYWINDCNDHSHVFNHFVKAWMPLPEPFGEEKDGKTD